MKYKLLKDVCNINMGQSPDSNSYNENGDGVPFFQGNADFGERYPIVKKWCNTPTKMAASEDILISVRAPIGAVNYAKENCCIGRGLAAITPDKTKVSPKFIFWLLKRKKDELNDKGTGSTFKAIGRTVLEEILIPDIEIEKQIESAEILEKMYTVMQAKHQEISKLDDLVKARFVEMFGNSNYPSEPLNNNAIEMFIGPFGSSLKNEVFVNAEDGFCMVYEQKHAIQKTLDVPTRYVSKSKHEELKRFTILGGDIIVSCRGTIGEIFIVPADAPMGIMHPSIMKIRLNAKKYNQKFFVFALEQYMDEHNAEANGSGVKMAVSATVLGKSDFVIPPMEVQNQFAAFVEQVDKSKAAVQKSLNKLQILFDKLMQEYFG